MRDQTDEKAWGEHRVETARSVVAFAAQGSLLESLRRCVAQLDPEAFV